MNGKDEKIDLGEPKPERKWILSNRLIKKSDLKPAPNMDGMTVRAEDDKWYDMDVVLWKILAKFDNINLEPGKPLAEGIARPCPVCGSGDRRISPPGVTIISAMTFDYSKMAICNNCGAIYEYKK